ncbi:MAG: hypothetical protein JWO37_2210 [Acidimicrobiales bacterium]|jgi:hypothetical protein|nr:hypothetical protein [Acidimicrobiales bacterium]
MSDPSELARQLDDLHHRIQDYLDSWQALPGLIEQQPPDDIGGQRDGGIGT